LSILAGLSWILWREESPGFAARLAQSEALLAMADTDADATPIGAFLADLAGQTETAQLRYRQLHALPGAALVAIRQGDRQIAAEAWPLAQAAYEQALQWWEETRSMDGVVLTRFRLAETFWHSKEKEQAKAQLGIILDALPDCTHPVQQNGRKLVRQAQKILNAKKRTSWPDWSWQSLDDAFRITLLYQTQV
jgi:hypothetical protein